MKRIYLDKNDCFIEGEKIKIRRDSFHYLKNVLRMTKNNKFIGFDGTGKEYEIIIEKVRDDFLLGKILHGKINFSSEPDFELILCQSIPKGRKMDFIISEVTQLGVKKIIPIISERVILKLDKEEKNNKIKRWNKIAEEASKISGRNTIPYIENFTNFKDALNYETDFSLIFWEGEKKLLKEVIRNIEVGKDNFKIKIFIGPEGGYTEKEINLAEKNGIISVSLGKRILKVETAAVIATGIIFYELENID